MGHHSKKRVTIRDVAAAAGVSYQTVSRVLNEKPDVAEQTRRHIKQIMHELGYQPSAVARSLALRRTHTLGVVTSDFSDWFFTQVIVGAEMEAHRAGYSLLLSNTERNLDQPKYVRLFGERRVDGMLFIRANAYGDSQQMIALSEQGLPVVTTAYDRQATSAPIGIVIVDNVKGGYMATHRLIETGHRRIAMIGGPSTWESVKDRMLGYQRALEEAGIEFDPTLIEYGDWNYESGYQAMRQLLARTTNLTALFAQNDRMALGAMRALREAGREIPDDVAVVGFDDIPIAAYSTPPLTTIRQPIIQVGQTAVQLLIQMIESSVQERKEVVFEPKLIVRQTC